MFKFPLYHRTRLLRGVVNAHTRARFHFNVMREMASDYGIFYIIILPRLFPSRRFYVLAIMLTLLSPHVTITDSSIGQCGRKEKRTVLYTHIYIYIYVCIYPLYILC